MPTGAYPRKPRQSTKERILAKITVNEEGCWIWQAQVNKGGYGQITITIAPYKSSPRAVHRIAYEEWIGPIPEGLELDHTCHRNDGSCRKNPCIHRRCANPYHVEPVTRLENVRRGNALYARKERSRRLTHCKNGHEFTSENTYYPPSRPTHRHCRICRRITDRVKEQKRRLEGRQRLERKIKTHCKNGHELTQENLYYPPATLKYRKCRICIYENGRKYANKKSKHRL